MTYLFVGIESGSLRMQKIIQKNLKLDHVYEKLSYISSKGVFITASFIFGFPDETEEDFEQTIALMVKLCKLPGIQLQHHLCAFFSGTELTAKHIRSIELASTFSDTTGEIAIEECKELIAANPVLFPHFFAYESALRDKAKYFPQFFACWVALRPVYEHIASCYYNNHYCDMLRDFSNANALLLSSKETQFNILQQDQFLNRFSNDSNYKLFKEIVRFALWNLDPTASGRNIFGFDVKAFLSGADLPDIKPILTIASCSTDLTGCRHFVLQTKA